MSYIEKIGHLIVSGRSHVQTLTGFDPYAIHVPLTKKELQIALQYNLTMQMALVIFKMLSHFICQKENYGTFYNVLNSL